MRSNQKGYTVIELLVVIAVSGVLIGALVPFIYNVTRGTGTITHRASATLQVQNASRLINQDVKLAATTSLVDAAPAVDTLTLQWTDKHDDVNVDHTVQYYLSGQDLKRDYDGVVTNVALYITNLEFSLSGSVVTVNITATPPDAPDESEQGSYNVTLRQQQV